MRLWISMLGCVSIQISAALIPILTHARHLGRAGQPEWDVFEGKTPDGEFLLVSFDAPANETEQTIFIRQDDVKLDWTVSLNGKKVGSLFLMEADLVHAVSIPPGALRQGRNELRISGNPADDIWIREIMLADTSKSNALASAEVQVTVRDASRNDPVPCRLTIVDSRGSLAALNDLGAADLAARPGVIYTGSGQARFRVFPGKYRVHATRGPEFSLASADFEAGRSIQRLELTLQRIVNTEGWIACDTHIHTLALSGHGDARLDERMITLAGEALEMPVATEHNRHADYLPAAKALGLDRYFTPVVGNEVTTARGHFNIFPVSPLAPPPDHRILHWPDLMSRIRTLPGLQMAILNHPTDTHGGFTPFAATNLNRLSGRNLNGDFEFSFDGMEVINSGAMRSDWMEPFQCWLALLNRGRKITAIGSSDSHDVSRFIVGQGRTYIRGNDSDPGRIDVSKACASLRQGHAVASLGMFMTLRIQDAPKRTEPGGTLSDAVLGAAGPGDLHPARADEIELGGEVEYPEWLCPDQTEISTTVTVFANGETNFVFVRSRPLAAPGSEEKNRQTVRTRFDRRVPKPAQDTLFVAIASAPAFAGPCWGLARPYQPVSRTWSPRLIAATNPIWVDVDGDGRFTSPRDYASALLARHGGRLDELIGELKHFDWATAVQTADLLDSRGVKLNDSRLAKALAGAGPRIRLAFERVMRMAERRLDE